MKNIVLFSSFLFFQTLEAKMYAVVVGINEYASSDIQTLNYSVADATAFYNYLNSVTSNKNNLEITYLTNSNATHSSIVSAIKSISTRATDKDRILLFFSGHGGIGAFTTYNCRSDGTNLLLFEEIKTAFNASKAKVKYIIADACHAGSFKNAPSYSDNLSNSKIMVFLSSRTNQSSRENSYISNGVFTQNLVESLTSNVADINNDKRITVKEMFVYVRSKTYQMTNGSQNPIIYGNFNSSSVIGTYK